MQRARPIIHANSQAKYSITGAVLQTITTLAYPPPLRSLLVLAAALFRSVSGAVLSVPRSSTPSIWNSNPTGTLLVLARSFECEYVQHDQHRRGQPRPGSAQGYSARPDSRRAPAARFGAVRLGSAHARAVRRHRAPHDSSAPAQERLTVATYTYTQRVHAQQGRASARKSRMDLSKACSFLS